MDIPKFKVPDIEKYKGTTCSKNQLKMYYRKMGAYAKDEELLIHSFQENLTKVAVTWYTNLGTFLSPFLERPNGCLR